MLQQQTRAMLDALNRGETLTITPQGWSMWPTLSNKRDSVVLQKRGKRLSKGEVALFLSDAQELVLHRIVRVGGGTYDFLGDGLLVKETNIPDHRVYAVMKGFYHKSKYIDATNAAYRLYCAVWLHPPVRWFRAPLLRIGYGFIKFRNRFRKQRGGEATL